MQEVKKYYSDKYKLYSYKVEVSVTPYDMAVLCSNHYLNSIAGIDIFYKMLEDHKVLREKTEVEKNILYAGLLCGMFPNYWAILMGKGCQGVAEVVRAITPTKKPRMDI